MNFKAFGEYLRGLEDRPDRQTIRSYKRFLTLLESVKKENVYSVFLGKNMTISQLHAIYEPTLL